MVVDKKATAGLWQVKGHEAFWFATEEVLSNHGERTVRGVHGAEIRLQGVKKGVGGENVEPVHSRRTDAKDRREIEQ